ncbi:uncharacterized protein BN676_02159 [Brachyspira sp. CAG:484]|nr:uncharacterized protein BN676_02159 [Brachyspira sp. CAG:484]
MSIFNKTKELIYKYFIITARTLYGWKKMFKYSDNKTVWFCLSFFFISPIIFAITAVFGEILFPNSLEIIMVVSYAISLIVPLLLPEFGRESYEKFVAENIEILTKEIDTLLDSYGVDVSIILKLKSLYTQRSKFYKKAGLINLANEDKGHVTALEMATFQENSTENSEWQDSQNIEKQLKEQNTPTDELQAQREMIARILAEKIKKVHENGGTYFNGIVDLNICSKEDLIGLDGFNEYKAQEFIRLREQGKVYYDIETFANDFNLQPHEMIMIQDRLIFPKKPAPKSGRTIDF